MKIFETVLAQIGVDVSLLCCRCCLNDTGLTGLLPLLTEKGAGVINGSPLGMGPLSNQGAPAWHPARNNTPNLCPRCRVLQNARAGHFAVQFAVANSAIQTTLIGMADPVILRRNVTALETPMDQSLLAEVQSILAPIRNQSWSTGRPENNDIA